jgi:mannan endo-1,4-beta-mannosidase
MHLGAASGPGSDRTRLLNDLDALAKLGVTHVRILGASEGPDSEPWRVTPSLQPCSGVYNSQARAKALYTRLHAQRRSISVASVP